MSPDSKNQAPPHLLIVDDEKSMRNFFRLLFLEDNFRISLCDNADSALNIMEKNADVDVMITDYKMPGMDGLSLLKEVKKHYPAVEIIMITAFGTMESAVEAMRLGAYDYITKPFNNDEIKLLVNNALEKRHLTLENKRLKKALKSRNQWGRLTGKSPAMQQIFFTIERIQDSPTTVLIQGESGTGKELVARAVHDGYSKNKPDIPFIAFNCSAIPETLIESELFGYKKGAFTGADQDRKGLFQAADGGTLFLDEVGELPLQVQVKLLRVLQERQIRPLGSSEDIPVNIRIIAATNRNLEEEVRGGRFREDLFYRLNVIALQIPPLRERGQDIPLLIEAFLEKHSLEMGKPLKGVSKGYLKRLLEYDFPGNIRELENMIERGVTLSRGEWLEESALPGKLLEKDVLTIAQPTTNSPLQDMDLDAHLQTIERDIIERALAQSRYSQVDCARLLKLSSRSLRYRLKKLGIKN